MSQLSEAPTATGQPPPAMSVGRLLFRLCSDASLQDDVADQLVFMLDGYVRRELQLDGASEGEERARISMVLEVMAGRLGELSRRLGVPG